MSTATAFRAKKAQAMRFKANGGPGDGYNQADIVAWVAGCGSAVEYLPNASFDSGGTVAPAIRVGEADFRRSEMPQVARVGDWVVQIGTGKFLAFPDDDFKMQYEVDE